MPTRRSNTTPARPFTRSEEHTSLPISRTLVGAVQPGMGRTSAGYVREADFLEQPCRPGDQILLRHGRLQDRKSTRLCRSLGPWSVRFSPAWGGPAQATFEKLISWSSHADPAIKYYSGTAVYSAAFELPKTLLKGDRRLYLDLGRVEVMAEVKVNGKHFPLLWKPPYRLDVTAATRAGQNTIEVTVVNLWPNRLIGDEQLPEDSERNPDGTLKSWPPWLLAGKPSPTGRYTFSMWRLWKKNDALLESGLIRSE